MSARSKLILQLAQNQKEDNVSDDLTYITLTPVQLAGKYTYTRHNKLLG